MPADRGRYQLLGEFGHGGMGSVFKGRDPDLGRDLAVKILLEEHQATPDLVRRFIEEAQIGGQLQHPGIVPVYELGLYGDNRPYFTMKLVRGRTLAALLKERAGPAHDLPRFLGIFEQVSQTVAYAHARGVIHRDLKPPNIMVGAFGEVQVMDWGLAKVLPHDGPKKDVIARPANETVVATGRTKVKAIFRKPGARSGTPACYGTRASSGRDRSHRPPRRRILAGLHSLRDLMSALRSWRQFGRDHTIGEASGHGRGARQAGELRCRPRARDPGP